MTRARELANSADKDFAGTVTVDNIVVDTDLQFATGATVTTILDEDNMGSDSAAALSTQQAIKAYVDTQVATVPTGDITEVTAGTGLTGGGTTGAVTLNIDSTVATLTGTQTLTNKSIDATQLTGTLANAVFPAVLPAVSGANLTNLPAAGIAAVVDDTTPQLGGNLDVNGNAITGSTVSINGATGEFMITATENGPVALRYDNNLKLTTKSDGVDITGELQADSLDIDGDGDITGNLTISGNLSVDSGTIKLDGNYPVGTANVALGDTALSSGSLSGGNNTAIGDQALYSNTSGAQVTGVGALSLANNSTGIDNTGLGYASLVSNTTGNYNTALGRSALNSNTTASNNTAIGYQSLYANTTGYENVAIGTKALDANTTGYRNTAVGALDTLGANTTGYYNVAIGREAMRYNTTGAFNTAVGVTALESNTSGQNNTALGYLALRYSSTNNNTAVGYAAGYNNTTGGNVVATGYQALYSNTTGNDNNAFGWQALYANTTGSENTAVGFRALANNTGDNLNTAIGYRAGHYATASQNTFVGAYCGTNFSTGHSAVFVGYQAGVNNTSGVASAVVGHLAGSSITTGDGLDALGHYAGGTVTTGSQNVCIGQYAGAYLNPITTGSYNVMLGQYCRPSASAGTHQIVVGYDKTGKGNSTGFISPAGGGVYQGNNSSTWSTTSDERLKKNIVDNNEGLDIINDVRIRNFEYRTVEEITELAATDVIDISGTQLGVIAQELEAVCPECVTTESTGVKSVNTDSLFWHMLNAVKQLSAKNDALEARIAALESN